MTAWWYVDKKKEIGPIETDELERLFQSGKIGAKTMLWHEGMDTWRPLDEVEEPSGLKRVMPPPLPPQPDSEPLSYPLATRVPRFFARNFELWCETLLITLILGAVLGRYSASFVEWINGPTSQLFGILCLPIALILDALLYRVFGNTPGKALLGLKVGTLDGKSLSLAQYLNRNFSMWARGLGLGIPLINVVTMAIQADRLGRGQQTSYDEPTGFRVYSKPSTWVRKMFFGFAFAGALVVGVLLNTTERLRERKVILSAAQTNYSWENPITRLSAKIDTSWKNSTQLNDGGQQIYVFSEQGDRAAMLSTYQTMVIRRFCKHVIDGAFV